MPFFVYEYVLVERGTGAVRAVVHHADCAWCNNGQGHRINAGRRHGLWKWHGPFDALDEARAAAERIGGKALSCRRCDPLGQASDLLRKKRATRHER